MNRDAVWQPLREELARWKAAGRTPDFWWRDDDAVEPTTALDRLVTIAERFAAPATLAVIPALTGGALAGRLSGASHLSVAVHGWSHQNHAPHGEKKQELGRHRDRDIVLDDLGQGFSAIARLYGGQMVPLLVPPWNRIDAGLLPGLAPLGFTALSAFGPTKPASLPVLNTNVDIIDWHGGRGCRDHAILVREVVAQMSRAFDGGDPVGILTHHLVHDEAAWLFLERLLAITAAPDAGAWRPVADLVEEKRAATA